MATQKYVTGGTPSYTSCFSTEVNSLASGNAVLSATQIDNTTNLDLFADVSVSLGSVTPTGSPFIGLYLYPLNEDGTSYGDGRFGSSAAGPPPSAYFVGVIPCVATAGVITGTLRGVVLPPSKFKFVLYNGTGVSLASSSNTIDYKTYNYSVA